MSVAPRVGLSTNGLAYRSALVRGSGMGYLTLGCRLVIAGIFLVSLSSKIRSRAGYRDFVAATAALTGAPAPYARRLAGFTVAAEAAAVLLTALPQTAPVGLVLAVGVLGAFTYILVRALRRNRVVTCRCFGSSTVPVGVPQVARNVFLVLVAVSGLVAAGLGGTPHVEWGGVTVTALAASICVLLLARLDELVDLFRPTAR